MNQEGPLQQVGPQKYQLVENRAFVMVANVSLHLSIIDDGDGHPRLEIAAIERYRSGRSGRTYEMATLVLPLDFTEDAL